MSRECGKRWWVSCGSVWTQAERHAMDRLYGAIESILAGPCHSDYEATSFSISQGCSVKCVAVGGSRAKNLSFKARDSARVRHLLRPPPSRPADKKTNLRCESKTESCNRRPSR